MSGWVRARAHNAVGFGGHTVFVVAGKPYRADDPLVVAFPDLFEPVPEEPHPERADAPPAEPFRRRERGGR